jgi:hypothetical protein
MQLTNRVSRRQAFDTPLFWHDVPAASHNEETGARITHRGLVTASHNPKPFLSSAVDASETSAIHGMPFKIVISCIHKEWAGSIFAAAPVNSMAFVILATYILRGFGFGRCLPSTNTPESIQPKSLILPKGRRKFIDLNCGGVRV